jgi:hypothetical protein
MYMRTVDSTELPGTLDLPLDDAISDFSLVGSLSAYLPTARGPRILEPVDKLRPPLGTDPVLVGTGVSSLVDREPAGRN